MNEYEIQIVSLWKFTVIEAANDINIDFNIDIST
jgi:hypothetical protein